jgi:lysophospholipase L1-like esterase
VFTAIAVLLSFAALEVMLRVFAPLPYPYHRRLNLFLPAYNRWGNVDFVAPDLEIPGVISPHALRTTFNRYGFPFREEARVRSNAREIRVAAVGGSTTECLVNQPQNRWTAVVERALEAAFPGRDATVLNLGVSSEATWGHLATMAQFVPDLDVDAVVFLIGVNDFKRANEGYEPLLDASFVKDIDLGASTRRWLGTNFQIARRLREMRLDEPVPDRSWIANAERRLQALPAVPFELRFSDSALAGYENNIVSLAALAQAHGIVPVFLTQPYRWNHDVLPAEQGHYMWSAYTKVGTGHPAYRVPPEKSAHLLDTLNTRLLDVCRRRHYHCYDLAAAIPRANRYFYDDMHFTDAGAAAVGELVTKVLVGVVRQESR